ncbi:hypothetical protein HNR68_000740 [Saccharopolyspora hordei]|uniref:Orc1-like AAA ATPase domain-containing protein n=1 Tax=Saccharopolyspora hordei TaxID=1838 RepID=A0A853AP48_9PSEU|nr:hypothetical protein [Saccharopolyspora hordei]
MRNPFAPGAGQRPPELAGRGRELDAFEVVLERVARGRPERSLVLTGLRGVGRTLLLGELRSMALRHGWGTGKVEARPEAGLRRPLSAALHRAIRDLAVRHRAPDRVEQVLAVLKAFALRANPDGAKLRDRWQPGIDVPAAQGRADPGDIEIDLVELFPEVAELAADVGAGITQDALFTISGGYPYFVQAYGKATWDAAVCSEITAEDVRLAAGDGGAGGGPRRARRRPSRSTSRAARPRCPRRGTASSRRGWCTPASAASSPSPSRTPAATCSGRSDQRPGIAITAGQRRLPRVDRALCSHRAMLLQTVVEPDVPSDRAELT